MDEREDSAKVWIKNKSQKRIVDRGYIGMERAWMLLRRRLIKKSQVGTKIKVNDEMKMQNEGRDLL